MGLGYIALTGLIILFVFAYPWLRHGLPYSAPPGAPRLYCGLRSALQETLRKKTFISLFQGHVLKSLIASSRATYGWARLYCGLWSALQETLRKTNCVALFQRHVSKSNIAFSRATCGEPLLNCGLRSALQEKLCATNCLMPLSAQYFEMTKSPFIAKCFAEDANRDRGL